MKSFQERFVALIDDDQITLNCDDAEALAREARGNIRYDINNVPDGKMVRVIVGDGDDKDEGNGYLNQGDVGFYTWKSEEDREDGFFLSFCDDKKEWQYIGYEYIEECEFELITDECIELECYEN